MAGARAYSDLSVCLQNSEICCRKHPRLWGESLVLQFSPLSLLLCPLSKPLPSLQSPSPSLGKKGSSSHSDWRNPSWAFLVKVLSWPESSSKSFHKMVQKNLSKLFGQHNIDFLAPVSRTSPGALSSPLLERCSLPLSSSLPPHHGSDWQSPWAGFSHCWSWGQEHTLLSGQAACSPPVSWPPELLAHECTQHLAGACVACQKAGSGAGLTPRPH